MFEEIAPKAIFLLFCLDKAFSGPFMDYTSIKRVFSLERDMVQSSRILVVENDQAVSNQLLMLLGTRGYKAEVVATGREALLRDNGNTDLILVDLTLPDDNGFRVCYLLKSDARTKHIPVIILGGRHQNGDTLQSFHIGADDFISMPLEAEELFARVEAALARCQVLVQGNDNKPSSLEMIEQLHYIVDNQSIVPHFQPIYFLKPIQLFGLEVLGRAQGGGIFANPEILFKAALHFGMYYELEMIVWRKAIEIAKKNFGDEHLFLNCSPYLIEVNRPEEIKSMFEGFRTDNRYVFLELTERSAISEYEVFFKCLSNYRWNGFRIAIDDLGAGYASLESIVQTKPEVVKIDRQIVTGLTNDPFKRSIVKLIVAFCRENSIICIAEGIETRNDLDTLIELGVEAGQGYYLCRPTHQLDLNAMRAINV